MTVVMTVSKTAAGADVSDTLAGGSLGLDIGQTVPSSYTPITSQAANTGAQHVFLYHDAVVDPVTSVGFYVDPYTGAYGGANSAAADYAALLALGLADAGTTNNNSDPGGGLSRGLHMDMSWNIDDTTQFAYAREASGQKRIFGKVYSGLDGAMITTAFPLHVDAMSYWNGTTEVDATVPVTGSIGKSSDTVLGNRGHIRMRFYLHVGASEGGVMQVDWIGKFSYTA